MGVTLLSQPTVLTKVAFLRKTYITQWALSDSLLDAEIGAVTHRWLSAVWSLGRGD